MEKLIVILDPAHGKNVLGKCSPDGKHREYLWSRERVESLRKKLESAGFTVVLTTESEDEPGLTYRKNFATKLKGERKLLLSLHNDASRADGKWGNPRGYSVFTTKGITKSDKCADIIINHLRREFPEIPFRQSSPVPLGKDFEASFTVLTGAGYMACLIEWLFQDNQEDVKLLSDEKVNERYENALVRAIIEIDKTV